jgi:hypothetical protein
VVAHHKTGEVKVRVLCAVCVRLHGRASGGLQPESKVKVAFTAECAEGKDGLDDGKGFIIGRDPLAYFAKRMVARICIITFSLI